jgi:hypothetical protein
MAVANFSAANKPILHIAELKNNGNPTILGAGYVDATGWQRLAFLLGVGALDTTVAAKVQETADGTTWVDVALAAITPLAATDDNSEIEIDVDLTAAGRKRYYRLLVTVGNGATGAALAVWAILSLYDPQAASDVGPADLEEVVAV